QFLGRDPRRDGRVCDFIPVQMKNGQHFSIANRIQELVGMERAHKRAGFGFAVPDYDSNDQIRIIKRCPECVRHAITEFSALMDGSGSFWSGVAADAAWERELLKELAHAIDVFALVWVDLRVRSFEIGIRKWCGSSVSGT